ncbi:hypothetical protein EYF80_028560 [Liparis tanakae]|uniref:Uncharacterized protein n=1 Tax=Liparis tanakae TaxID=230148 RepID=A0A4Z2H7Q6_9TELE|nr:hypothetical protein EYF80_028560 [Liparis tanakae]
MVQPSEETLGVMVQPSEETLGVPSAWQPWGEGVDLPCHVHRGMSQAICHVSVHSERLEGGGSWTEGSSGVTWRHRRPRMEADRATLQFPQQEKKKQNPEEAGRERHSGVFITLMNVAHA